MMQAHAEQPDVKQWIGRTENARDVIDVRQAVLMQSILPTKDRFETGAVLPPLWNWLYFHAPEPLDRLGRDGHPKKGGFMPPVALPRRMWAGGRFEFQDDLRIGDSVTRRSKILAVTPKRGKSGALCFVTVEHCFLRDESTVWREEHDVVYRDDPSPEAPPSQQIAAPDGHTHRQTVEPSPVMLFRYSALMFNGHRIHYDRDYARDVEGYPDLVFHGPLTATMLAEFCRGRSQRRMTSFAYRAVSPLFCSAPFGLFLNMGERAATAWACTPDGALAMTAEAEFG